VHAARPVVNVVIEAGRATAIVVPAVAGGSVINIPELCLEIELPTTGSDSTDLLLVGGAALAAGVAATEASRRRRRRLAS
jgi:hypothetical protein